MGIKNIFVVRTALERAIEKQIDLCMCFIDSEKVFDTGWHEFDDGEIERREREHSRSQGADLSVLGTDSGAYRRSKK